MVRQAATFLEVKAGQPVAGLARQLLAHYDKNKDSKLDLKESGFDPKLFAALDADGDGKLDAKELEGFFRRDPDLVLRGRVGALSGVGGLLSKIGLSRGPVPSRAEVFNPSRKEMPLAAKVRRLNNDTLAFDLGDTQFQVQGGQGYSGNFQGSRQFFLRQFDASAKKGVLEKKPEAMAGQNRFVYQLFAIADRDGDGKLTRKEFVDYLDLQVSGSGCTAAIQVNDLGRNLFTLIDANGDGQLSVRELRSAWERVQPLTRGGAGLAEADIPRRIQISMGQGNTFFSNVGQLASTPMKGRVPVKTVGPVPAWFTKMDRNGDGDVSRREFLGTEEEFRMLDADGDGLISADEARAYEAKLKKAGGGKP
jgi:Ca2+-binding EF-hand superfamily protein